MQPQLNLTDTHSAYDPVHGVAIELSFRLEIIYW